MQISNNLLIGTTDDNGAKLQVNGRVNATGGGSNGVLVSSNSGSVTIPTTGLSLNTGFNVGYLQNFNGGNYVDLYYGASRHIFDGGNVGIGTTSPNANLHLKSSSGSAIFRIEDSAGVSVGRIQANAGDGNINFFEQNGYALTFGTSNTERARITSGGNFLIGTTTNGNSKLKINGLPTSSSGLASGDVWNDGGTLKIA